MKKLFIGFLLFTALLLAGCTNCDVVVWSEHGGQGFKLSDSSCNLPMRAACIESGGIAAPNGDFDDDTWSCYYYLNPSQRDEEITSQKIQCTKENLAESYADPSIAEQLCKANGWYQ